MADTVKIVRSGQELSLVPVTPGTPKMRQAASALECPCCNSSNMLQFCGVVTASEMVSVQFLCIFCFAKPVLWIAGSDCDGVPDTFIGWHPAATYQKET